jgi:hypothetical protein
MLYVDVVGSKLDVWVTSYNEYIKGLNVFINFVKKDILDNVRENLCYPYKHCKNEKKYHTNDVLMSHLIENEFIEDYRCWNN